MRERRGRFLSEAARAPLTGGALTLRPRIVSGPCATADSRQPTPHRQTPPWRTKLTAWFFLSQQLKMKMCILGESSYVYYSGSI